MALESARITSFEALLRWKHPERGIVSPHEFIPIAEETGLIVPLGRWVLEQASRQLAVWNQQRSAEQAISIGVNVSRKQLQCPGFFEDVQRVLHETGIEGGRKRHPLGVRHREKTARGKHVETMRRSTRN